ncbi:hypothetical protein BS47DRAFT_1482574 [Hydnum rufescens UP504]|uniref:Major facilitator superfamily (MFS) profile domain-containing protein n=1 Tax=Hydnum rufescens UP504 TaxID=1448309 RepID=A0A9P6B6A6_9AGAM|nr:hypothetical protein BS47DRAFT_1482574 [Hydnum rufescens UP504]
MLPLTFPGRRERPSTNTILPRMAITSVTSGTSFHPDSQIQEKGLLSTRSSDTGEYYEAGDSASERRLLRKLDWHLLPLISVMHLLSFLDRSNFGNAKVAGMEASLHLRGNGFNIAAALFYVFYAAFEVPSNLLMKKIGPHRWFPFQMVCWGIVCTLTCLTKNLGGLIAIRIFLGIAEAGLFPGLAYYISLWYKKDELARRISIFYASTTSSGAFGGILSWWILKMNGVGHLAGWRWIFALEGMLTVVVGVFAFWGMHGLPEDAKFINEEERTMIQVRLAKDREHMNTHYSFAFVRQGFADWKSYFFAIIYLGNAIPVYSLSLFLPSIIANLGYKAADAQLLSTPPYILAMIVALINAWLSDKYKVRGPLILCSQLLAIIGFTVLLGTKKAKYGYMATFFTCSGTYATVPVLLSWASNNTGGDTKKAVRIALMVGLATWVVYALPLSTGIMTNPATTWDTRLNKRKEKLCREKRLSVSDRVEFQDLGDDSPLFRFTL